MLSRCCLAGLALSLAVQALVSRWTTDVGRDCYITCVTFEDETVLLSYRLAFRRYGFWQGGNYVLFGNLDFVCLFGDR